MMQRPAGLAERGKRQGWVTSPTAFDWRSAWPRGRVWAGRKGLHGEARVSRGRGGNEI